jgi:hypothetical protein
MRKRTSSRGRSHQAERGGSVEVGGEGDAGKKKEEGEGVVSECD